MSDENDDSTAFLRQRRDLFVISAILLLIPIAEIKSTNSFALPVLGVSMTIGKPEVIFSALWLLWIYWYLRYIQAYFKLNKNLVKENYSSVKLSKNLVKESYSNSMHDELRQYFYKLANKKNKQLFELRAIKREQLLEDYKIHNPSILEQYIFTNKATFMWRPSADQNNGQPVILLDNVIEIKGLRFYFIKSKSLFNVIFRDTEVTEYYFPFIFGLLPAIYYLYTHI